MPTRKRGSSSSSSSAPPRKIAKRKNGDVANALLENLAEIKARTKATSSKLYVSALNHALNRFTTWTSQYYDHSTVVKAVMYKDDENDGRLTFDATKLAKSFENNINVYFNYTLSYQKKMIEKQKSGLGHIKVLRTALRDFFMSKSVELSKVALANLTKWQKSRIRDDMTAKMKDIDPVKFSNARSSLPM